MPGQNYYLLSALPALGELGSTPPMALGKLLETVADAPNARRLIETLLLADDLLQRASVLAGQIDAAEPAVLTDEQVRDEAPLPPELVCETDATRRVADDTVWEAYFRHAAAVAGRCGSDLAAQWVAHEVALRNALAAARAKTLELEAEAYVVATDLAADEPPDAVVAEWSQAATPLTAAQVLDQHRWDWLDQRDAWFSFADDELVAYAARLMLLWRWHRIQQNQPQTESETT